MNSFKNPTTFILLLILLLALSVRLLGINYGLPYVLYPDEAVIVNHAMAFGTGDLNPHYFIYPSLYMYVLFIVYGMTYIGGRLLGAFGSTDDFIRLAEMYVETINNAWCAIPLFWFNQMDGRGPWDLEGSIREHQSVMKWYGEHEVPEAEERRLAAIPADAAVGAVPPHFRDRTIVA